MVGDKDSARNPCRRQREGSIVEGTGMARCPIRHGDLAIGASPPLLRSSRAPLPQSHDPHLARQTRRPDAIGLGADLKSP